MSGWAVQGDSKRCVSPLPACALWPDCKHAAAHGAMLPDRVGGSMRAAAADTARLLPVVTHEHVAARGAERYPLRAASHGADKSSCTTPRKHVLPPRHHHAVRKGARRSGSSTIKEVGHAVAVE